MPLKRRRLQEWSTMVGESEPLNETDPFCSLNDVVAWLDEKTRGHHNSNILSSISVCVEFIPWNLSIEDRIMYGSHFSGILLIAMRLPIFSYFYFIILQWMHLSSEFLNSIILLSVSRKKKIQNFVLAYLKLVYGEFWQIVKKWYFQKAILSVFF